MSADADSEIAKPCSRAVAFSLGFALLAGIVSVALEEAPRWSRAIETGQWGSLLIDFNYNSTIPAILFLLLPVCFFLRRHNSSQQSASKIQGQRPGLPIGIALSIICGLLSVGMSAWVSHYRVGNQHTYQFGEIPPAYHDEYSYLFQAESYQSGRLAFPSHADHPELFTQVHVLNEGQFASRYFPVTGLVIAPFQAMGNPYLGHWLCGGLTAFFMYWIGMELSGPRTALLAGFMTATSPGLVLFSNLLLAHHPTLLGLSCFLYFYLRMMRTKSATAGVVAGCGLTFAMLARPMSAAGFAFPMGVLLLAGLLKPNRWMPDRKTALKYNLAVGVPVLVGILSLLPINRAITGDAFTTPYSLYTETYTPRHVYGFENGTRGDLVDHKSTFEKYDDWAENLTPDKARVNVAKRLYASTVWTWGLVPLVMATMGVLVLMVEPPWNRWTMVGFSLATIHLAHVPYWFSGIMDWHYVFESSLILILILAEATRVFFLLTSRWGMKLWWSAMLLAPMLTVYIPDGECWQRSRMQLAVDELSFSRLRYQRFEELLASRIPDARALVLIDHDPSDLHIDYVTNSPALDDRILKGRADEGVPDDSRRQQLKSAFPDRELWFFDAATFSLAPL